MLCENCKQITIDPKRMTARPSRQRNFDTDWAGKYEVGKTRVDQYPDFIVLKVSGDAGCDLCSSLRQRLLQDFDQNPPQMKVSGAGVDIEWDELFAEIEDEEVEKGEWNHVLEISLSIWNRYGNAESLMFLVGNGDHVVSRVIYYDIEADEGIADH
jgi:hypothetical protein